MPNMERSLLRIAYRDGGKADEEIKAIDRTTSNDASQREYC